MPFSARSTPVTWLAENALGVIQLITFTCVYCSFCKHLVCQLGCILVKESLPSISLSFKLLHQSSEESNRSKKDKQNKCPKPVVVCSDEEVAKSEKSKKNKMDSDAAEKEVVVASSPSGSRDGQPSEDELAKKVVAEMMGQMMQMMKNQLGQETEVKKADDGPGPSSSAGPSIPPAVEPVEGDLHPVMWLDCN